jgi:hypothetical protein
MAVDVGMTEPRDEVEIERVIVKAIERHARGNPEALARLLVAELRRAGFEIRRRARPGDARRPLCSGRETYCLLRGDPLGRAGRRRPRRTRAICANDQRRGSERRTVSADRSTEVVRGRPSPGRRRCRRVARRRARGIGVFRTARRPPATGVPLRFFSRETRSGVKTPKSLILFRRRNLPTGNSQEHSSREISGLQIERLHQAIILYLLNG